MSVVIFFPKRWRHRFSTIDGATTFKKLIYTWISRFIFGRNVTQAKNTNRPYLFWSHREFQKQYQFSIVFHQTRTSITTAVANAKVRLRLSRTHVWRPCNLYFHINICLAGKYLNWKLIFSITLVDFSLKVKIFLRGSHLGWVECSKEKEKLDYR